MQEKNNHNHCEGSCGCDDASNCGCGMRSNSCMWCSCSRHRIVKWVVAFAILAAVFLIGVKIGKLKAMLEDPSWYGYPPMPWYKGSSKELPGYGMMPSEIIDNTDPALIDQ